jgi:hypothetical protein
MGRFTGISLATYPPDVDTAASHYLQPAKKAEGGLLRDAAGHTSMPKLALGSRPMLMPTTASLVLRQDEQRSSSMATDE